MRGKVLCISLRFNTTRITPAYAGKRVIFCSFDSICQDHPRLCGEKYIPPLGRPPFLGSPPPMRGKGGYPVHRPSVVRITPAYAGKSATHSVSRIAGRDHPRLCGEKSLISIMSLPRTGSPPPMRGKAARSTPYLGTARITPAYAGKSHKKGRVSVSIRDHPRLCGEKL